MYKIDPLVLGKVKVEMDNGDKFTAKACLTRTPADWADMYGKGSASCISYNPMGHFAFEFKWMRDHNLHCMSHLSFNPYVKGFYIKHPDGQTIARSVVFSQKPHDIDDEASMRAVKWDSAAWYWSDGTILNGRASGSYAKLATMIAKEFDIDLGGMYYTTVFRDIDQGTYHIKYKVELDPILVDNKPYFFMPYMDNHTPHFLVTWNKKKGKFIFDCHDDKYKAHNYFALRKFVSGTQDAHQWAISPEEMIKLGYVS